MNKKLRKRKIKALYKISEAKSSIQGNSWEEYRSITSKSIDHWNYKESEKEAKIEEQKSAINELWIKYTEYYSYKNGLRYSDIETLELERKSFQDYKVWYDELLKIKGMRAISPSTALKFLDEEIRGGEIPPGKVDYELVDNYEFDKIKFDIDCEVYNLNIGQNYQTLSLSEFKNILNSGISDWPILKYICHKGILYKILETKDLSSEFSEDGKIECNPEIPFNNHGILKHIAENSHITLKNSKNNNKVELNIIEPEDYRFFQSWIANAKVNQPRFVSAELPVSWVRRKIEDELKSGDARKLVKKYMGQVSYRYFDLKKNYSEDPTLYFEKKSNKRMTIMSDEKIWSANMAEILGIAATTAEGIEATTAGVGLFRLSPPVALGTVILSVLAGLADIGASYAQAGYLEDLNTIDLTKLEEKELEFSKKILNLEEHMKRAEEIQDEYSDEYGALAFTLFLSGSTLDVTNDLLERSVSQQYGVLAGGVAGKGAQALSLFISLYDLFSGGYKGEKTTEMKAAERNLKIIYQSLK